MENRLLKHQRSLGRGAAAFLILAIIITAWQAFAALSGSLDFELRRDWPFVLFHFAPGGLLLAVWLLWRRFPDRVNTIAWALGAVFLLGGLWADYFWISGYGTHILFLLHFCNLIPGVLILTLTLMATRDPKLSHVPLGCGAPVMVVITLILLSVNHMLSWFMPIRTPARYDHVLQKYRSAEFITHFPRSIPGAAENVRFHYQPMIMQGAGFMELRFVLDAGELARVRKSMRRLGQVDEKSQMKPRDHFYGPSRDDLSSFDEHAEFMTEPANHGHSGGIALNSTTGEVLYWAAFW